MDVVAERRTDELYLMVRRPKRAYVFDKPTAGLADDRIHNIDWIDLDIYLICGRARCSTMEMRWYANVGGCFRGRSSEVDGREAGFKTR